jgi:two-component system response regulator HydG
MAGNLRELKNVVKRSALLADGEIIDVTSLPFELVNHKRLVFENPHPKRKLIKTNRYWTA